MAVKIFRIVTALLITSSIFFIWKIFDKHNEQLQIKNGTTGQLNILSVVVNENEIYRESTPGSNIRLSPKDAVFLRFSARKNNVTVHLAGKM